MSIWRAGRVPGRSCSYHNLSPRRIKGAKYYSGEIKSNFIAKGQVSSRTPPVAGGLEKVKYHGRSVYEHFGSDEGFKADIIYFPATQLSVIGLTNNSNFYGLLKLLLGVSDVVHEGRVRLQSALEEHGGNDS